MAKEKPEMEEWNEFYTGFIDMIFDNCTRYCKDEAGKFARRLLKDIYRWPKRMISRNEQR
jgi:hypothetical protein